MRHSYISLPKVASFIIVVFMSGGRLWSERRQLALVTDPGRAGILLYIDADTDEQLLIRESRDTGEEESIMPPAVSHVPSMPQFAKQRTTSMPDETNSPPYNTTTIREKKVSTTPSNWWPTKHWITKCVNNVEKLQRRRNEQSISLLSCNTNRAWSGYRLGDCIKKCKGCPIPGVSSVDTNNSFAAEYRDLACLNNTDTKQRKMHIDTVTRILKDRDHDQRFTKPDPRALVIHLRLGDVIEKASTHPRDMLIHGGTPAHHKNYATAIKSAYEYLAEISSSGADTVQLVGGAHFGMCQKTWVYATCLRDTIKQAGWEVSLQVNGGTPDQDFYFMSHAKMISTSTGGYSRLIGKMVLHRGGKVIGRYFPAKREKSTNLSTGSDSDRGSSSLM